MGKKLACRLGRHKYYYREWGVGYTRDITCAFCPHKRNVEKTHQFGVIDRDLPETDKRYFQPQEEGPDFYSGPGGL